LITFDAFLRTLPTLHRSPHISDAIPIIHVRLMMIMRVVAFYLLLCQAKAVRAFAPNAAAS
jgi:hypothetical protein